MSKVDLSKRGKLYQPSDIIDWAKEQGYTPLHQVPEGVYLVMERGAMKPVTVPILNTVIPRDNKDTRYFATDGSYTSTDGSQGFIFERNMQQDGENYDNAGFIETVHFLRMPTSKNYKLFLIFNTKKS